MVKTTYLEITSPEKWVRRYQSESDVVVRQCVVKQPSFNRFLYKYIGAEWNWTFRLSWSPQRWCDVAGADNLRTFVAYKEGSIAGYYELCKQGNDVEIGIFGLAPEFIGQGYGRILIDSAVENAFAWSASRVWLHTCTDDHPNALNNYLKSGFTIYKVQDE